jgi:hypothetical protein
MLNDLKIVLRNDGFKPHFIIATHFQIALTSILTALLTILLLNAIEGVLSLLNIELPVQVTFISFFLLLPIELTFQNRTIPKYE